MVVLIPGGVILVCAGVVPGDHMVPVVFLSLLWSWFFPQPVSHMALCTLQIQPQSSSVSPELGRHPCPLPLSALCHLSLAGRSRKAHRQSVL